jgi:hypothetical protein
MYNHIFEDAEQDEDGYFNQRVKHKVENVIKYIDTILFQLLFNTYISNIKPQPTLVTAASWSG